MRMRAWALSALLVAGLAGAAAAKPSIAPQGRATAPMALLSGPDVSSNNHSGRGGIGWGKVSAGGRSFAVIKATGEYGYVNPWFAADWKGAGRAGLARAAYHYAIPSSRKGDAVRQATKFVQTVAKAGGLHDAGTLPLVLDLERTGGLRPAALQAWTRSFLTTVSRLSGETPMIYTYTDFWKFQVGNAKSFTGYPLWIASYTAHPPSPLPGGWKTWTLWQYTDHGRLPGVRGDVDLSVFHGSFQSLATFADARPLPLLQRWRASGGLTGPLGVPLGPLTTYADGGTSEDFTGGSLFTSPAGVTSLVTGAALARYAAGGGPLGPLGWPLADTATTDPTGALAAAGQPLPTLTPFTAGELVAGAAVTATPAYLVPAGSMQARFDTDGGVDGPLGLPTADAVPAADGFQQVYANGQLLDSQSRGVHELSGPVLAAWLADGGAASKYQLPSSEIYTTALGEQAQFGKYTITAK